MMTATDGQEMPRSV